jgi:hypothetical protein
MGESSPPKLFKLLIERETAFVAACQRNASLEAL